MAFSGFSNEDFDVFLIEGLDARMEALKMKISPKLESLGQHYAPTLSALTGNEMYAHVAKHARRTKNPPNDTWVAFANNPRGYKMLPHFEIGLWKTHLFIWFAVIYESPNKQDIGKRLDNQIRTIFSHVPKDFVWSVDHTKRDTFIHGQLTTEQLHTFFQNLQTNKKAEILCGYLIDRKSAVAIEPVNLLQQIDYVFSKLTRLYKLL